MDLATPLTYIKGVGPARAAMLEAKGLRTVEDLLGYVPFRYEDRSNVKAVAELAPGEMATVIAEVRSASLSGFKRRNLGLFEASFTDRSRGVLLGKWFHGGYLANVLAAGQKVALYGKVEFDSYAGQLTMLHPEFEILAEEDDSQALKRPCTPRGRVVRWCMRRYQSSARACSGRWYTVCSKSFRRWKIICRKRCAGG